MFFFAEKNPKTFAILGLGVLLATGARAQEVPVGPLDGMPSTTLTVDFLSEHGTVHASYAGPLLWTVLRDTLHVAPRDVPHLAVTVTGQDGYRAILALGEIAPEFENKQVILADHVNGAPLPAGHFRLIVPGDKRGGRSVRDVAHIVVVSP